MLILSQEQRAAKARRGLGARLIAGYQRAKCTDVRILAYLATFFMWICEQTQPIKPQKITHNTKPSLTPMVTEILATAMPTKAVPSAPPKDLVVWIRAENL